MPSPGRPESVGRARLSDPFWISTLYFAEGLPFMLVRYLGGVTLTDWGVREATLGFLNFLGIPWNTKFLWAPLVDMVGTRRGWLLRAELVIALGALVLALFAHLGPADGAVAGATTLGWAIHAFLVVLVLLATAAATHDIGIDGYYLEAIPEPARQAGFTGLRVTAYRVAIIFAKSVVVAVAGLLSWTWGYLAVAAVMGALFLLHAYGLPLPTAEKRDARAPGDFLRTYGRAFVTWLDQPRIGLVLAFVITYKLGDEVLFSMNTPFLMRDIGLTKEQLSWLNGVVGTVASISGSLVSAWAIGKWGLKRAVWPLTLGMNVNLWAYVWLASTRPDPTSASGLALIAIVVAYEQWAAGLGNAVLVVYLMRTCKAEFKASHYAIASALPSLGGTLIGGFSGFVVEASGYVTLFLLAFAAALPSMICLMFLRLPDDSPRRS